MGNLVLHHGDDGKVAHREEIPPDWEAYAREIGHNLARIRRARGLSQERVAARAGISANQYGKYEQGLSRPDSPMNPSLINFIALSQALEVSVAELLPPSLPDLRAGA